MNFAVIGLGSFGIKRAQAIKNSKLAKLMCIYDINNDQAKKAEKTLQVPINKYDENMESANSPIYNKISPVCPIYTSSRMTNYKSQHIIFDDLFNYFWCM